ncbi:hypothetical protein HN51_053439 [Arachis hypogaea]|uniref:Uncharacterized protein n=1 Tax=Arachis hypogaea TaxID=3818 RepID=A0A6B9V3G6_ARAHY|nr:uncharacterized protein DS421_19g638400 [Arachis hypogaea]
MHMLVVRKMAKLIPFTNIFLLVVLVSVVLMRIKVVEVDVCQVIWDDSFCDEEKCWVNCSTKHGSSAYGYCKYPNCIYRFLSFLNLPWTHVVSMWLKARSQEIGEAHGRTG